MDYLGLLSVKDNIKDGHPLLTDEGRGKFSTEKGVDFTRDISTGLTTADPTLI